VSHEADTAYYGSKFKCPFPGCHDTERHTHAQPAWEAALTESRREVSLLKQALEEKQPGMDSYYHGLFAEQMALRKKAEAENATLRREVEDQASRAEKAVAENYALRQEVERWKKEAKFDDNEKAELRRQVEEQAAKLAVVEQEARDCNQERRKESG
jgi:uncharacterized iron-regulated protein